MALGYAALKFKVEGDPLIARIDAILPQTQCGQCGFPGCKPYATAIAEGRADINQCPPGGDAGVRALADLMGMEYKPLNAENGVEKPKAVAFIDEPRLHWLHAVYSSLPCRCHFRRCQTHAHHYHQRVHGLRAMCGAVSSRLHYHGADCRNAR